MDETKLAKLLELNKQREAIEAEINALLGGERPKRTWMRRAPAEATTTEVAGA